MSYRTLNCLLFVFIAGIFLPTAVTAQLHEAFIPTKQSAIRQACFATQRVIMGAVEMYNMDNAEMITDLEDQMVRENGLLTPSYIRTPISKELPCKYYSEGNLASGGEVICSIHGCVNKFDKNLQELKDFKESAQALILKGKKVDGADRDGVTALHLAVETEMTLIVEYLLSIDANPALRTNEGFNAIDLAMNKGNLEIARLLLKHGCKPDQKVINSLRKKACDTKLERMSGNIQIKVDKTWKKLTKDSKILLPATIRSNSSSNVFLVLAGGTSVELKENSELEIEYPTFDKEFPIVVNRVLHLEYGEIRVSSSYMKNQCELTTVAVSDKFLTEFNAGKFKFSYSPQVANGAVVARTGTANVKSISTPSRSEKLCGFYKIKYENGVLGSPHQAYINKEFK